MKARIRITLVGRMGPGQCHRGHRPGDSWDYDTERGMLCPMAMHVAFPFIDIMRYGGEPPRAKCGEIRFCCPDTDVINIFKLEKVEES